jgi:RNA polymerase sigma-70 factor (ECF subfamily)
VAGATDAEVIERTFREDSGRAVATLIRLFGDVDVAEEAVQDAFVVASERWRVDGIPPSPAGWIVTTARHRAIDRVRRESKRNDRHRQSAVLFASADAEEVGPVKDDQLRLIFTCCHPALAAQSQVALTLKLIAGLTTEQIARGFLVSESTMAQRLVRAKAKIRDAHIPYRIPRDAELPERLRSVLAVVYLVYNEGYLATGGDAVDRQELRREAIRLARQVAELMPDEPEALGLLALLLLNDSRAPARLTLDQQWIRLADQDRSLWDRELIDEGQAIVRSCLKRNQPGPYQVQAAIAAVHSDALTADATDWPQIVALYDHLYAMTPNPIVALNRAIAVAEVDGPSTALEIIDELDLRSYYLWYAFRGDLLQRLGENERAASSFEQAMSLTENPAEQLLLRERLGI